MKAQRVAKKEIEKNLRNLRMFFYSPDASSLTATAPR